MVRVHLLIDKSYLNVGSFAVIASKCRTCGYFVSIRNSEAGMNINSLPGLLMAKSDNRYCV